MQFCIVLAQYIFFHSLNFNLSMPLYVPCRQHIFGPSFLKSNLQISVSSSVYLNCLHLMSLPMWLDYSTASDQLRVILGVSLSFHQVEIFKFLKGSLLSCSERTGEGLILFPESNRASGVYSHAQPITLSSGSQATGTAIWQNETVTGYSTRPLMSIISFMW